MAIAEVQRQTFEERLNRIQVGGSGDAPAAAEVPATARQTRRVKERKAKSRVKPKAPQIKKAENTGTGPNSIMMPLAMFLGALSVMAGRLTEFQLFATDGLGQITPPVAELAIYGHYLFAGVLALLFMWAFEMDSLIRRVALILGFAAMVMYEPLLVERIPNVYATFYSPGYVTGILG